MELDNTPPSALARQGHTHAKRLRRSLLIAHLLLLFVSIPLGLLATTGTSLARPIPEVALAPKARRADLAPPARSIVFVHGFNSPFTTDGSSGNGASMGWDCQNKNVWGTAKPFLRKMTGIGDLRTIKYYQGDKNCDADLHAKAYADHCLHYQSGGEGTNNESIYHLSCLFAWYLYDNFGQKPGKPGSSEIVIAHSMGGLILREAIYQVQKKTATFPPNIGHITEAITLNTPHMGWDLKHVENAVVKWGACKNCQQIKDMNTFSPFMMELLDKGQDPQAGGTEWTLIGSDCDEFVDGDSATIMNGVNHAILYIPPKEAGAYGYPGITVCYDHGGALHDQDRNLNAAVIFCDTQDVTRRGCANVANNKYRQMRRYTAPHALQAIYEVITNPGYPPYSQVGGPDGPTCTTGPHKQCS